MTIPRLQQLINEIKSRQLPLSKLREYLHHDSPLVRANAVEVFLEHVPADESLLDEVVAFAKSPDHTFRLMGTTSVAHVAVLGLMRSRLEQARLAGEKLVRTWPEPDRQDLIWFLKSEGIELWGEKRCQEP